MARLGYGLGGPHAKAPWLACAVCLALASCGARAPAGAFEPAAQTRELVTEARSAAAERRYREAEALYERAIRQAPDPASRGYANREWGRALALFGDYDEAIRALDRATQAAPALAGAWHDLGVLRYRAGRVEGAEIALRRAASLRPRDPRPRIALAAMYVNAERFADARRRYLEVLDLDIPEDMREAIEEAMALLGEEERAR